MILYSPTNYLYPLNNFSYTSTNGPIPVYSNSIYPQAPTYYPPLIYQSPAPNSYLNPYPIISLQRSTTEDRENLYQNFMAGNIAISNNTSPELASFLYSRRLQDLPNSQIYNDSILSKLVYILPCSTSVTNDSRIYRGYNFGPAYVMESPSSLPSPLSQGDKIKPLKSIFKSTSKR